MPVRNFFDKQYCSVDEHTIKEVLAGWVTMPMNYENKQAYSRPEHLLVSIPLRGTPNLIPIYNRLNRI